MRRNSRARLPRSRGAGICMGAASGVVRTPSSGSGAATGCIGAAFETRSEGTSVRGNAGVDSRSTGATRRGADCTVRRLASATFCAFLSFFR